MEKAKAAKGRLILVRHGQSVWNAKNLFTGWVDVPLNEKGMEEAISSAKHLYQEKISLCFTSDLLRAKQTLCLLLLTHPEKKTLVFCDQEASKRQRQKIYSKQATQETLEAHIAWQLNERYYGELQGKNKKEMIEQFGQEQVHLWRRSYETAPPQGESLKDTAQRTLPYFQEEIAPHVQKGKTVLVCAHGNSLRSIIMHLENLSKEEVTKLEIPTGKPCFYTWGGQWTKT